MSKQKIKEGKNFCMACGKTLPNIVDFFCIDCMVKINRGHDLW